MPLQPRNSHVFAGDYLDRRAEARAAADWLAAARADPAAVYLVMSGTEALMRLDAAGDPVAIQLLAGTDPRLSANSEARLSLLGWFRGVRCVLVEVAPEAGFACAAGEAFRELRPFASRLPELDAGLLAYARALAIWRSNHRHCGRCGQPTRPTRAGHALQCVACGHESFPRIDPAIIVLVTDGRHALLGRQPGWPAGRYSTIAGFVEPGEALEDAVRREVLEETGIAVSHSRYHSSQPWPFPSSLMLGFEASSPGGTPLAGDSELEDVRWFSREDVHAGRILLPPTESISRRLIEGWLSDAR
jgi:NAD+ diphosphatase